MESLQPGDVCVECSSKGLNHKLRYFYLNREEQLLKCESRRCLWPHNDAVSSSDEEDIEPPTHSTNADDDEFIKQLLEQLASGTTNESSMENRENNSSCDSSLPPNIPSSSDACSIEDILSSKWENAQQLLSSPKSALSLTPAKQTNDLEQCDNRSSPLSATVAATITTTTLSIPHLLSESEQPAVAVSNLKSVIAQCKAGDIAYTISIPQPELTPKSPAKKDLPKANPFQTPPKKASTMVRSQLQQKPQPPAPPTSSTASQFLNSLNRQPVQSARPRRSRQCARRESSNSTGTARPSTQDIKKTLERISRQKESRAESESEPELEQEAKFYANAKQSQ